MRMSCTKMANHSTPTELLPTVGCLSGRSEETVRVRLTLRGGHGLANEGYEPSYLCCASRGGRASKEWKRLTTARMVVNKKR